MILVLFDIDGTLIHSAGAGLRGMEAAFRDLHGRSDMLAGVPVAGRTDRAIVEDVFDRMGQPLTDAAFETLRAVYTQHLVVELQRPLDDGRCVLPGVIPLLDALDARRDIAIGLLTGNFVDAARIKLGHFGLWQRFPFGAFGDDHVHRGDLVPIALSRARALDVAVDPDRTVVIGDTPLDIACARGHGASVVAVASGIHAADELARHEPDLVVASLEDPMVLEWLDAFVG